MSCKWQVAEILSISKRSQNMLHEVEKLQNTGVCETRVLTVLVLTAVALKKSPQFGKLRGIRKYAFWQICH